jgi:hypothetical protein
MVGRIRRALLALMIGSFTALPGPTNVADAQAACHPILSPPAFRGGVPTPEQVLGFPLGSQEVTSAESDAYVGAVDAASDLVVSGTAATSVQGRPIRYAIVGRDVSDEGLTDLRASVRALMDPTIPDAEAAALAGSTPEILLMQANVHGSEESGTDASLQILYELADRDDCVADTILDNAVVVFIPIQNPDGREADTRRNAYDIDMNRDWFARTQPETDGKLEFLRQYPPVLDLDVHEMGSFTYFFPPNSDPIYHEVADESIDWIDGIYGPAMAAEFQRQKIRYFNYEPYDFFGTFYGDTVPTVGFHSAGMTFEKYSGDPLSQRLHEQYTSSLVSIFAAAANKERILEEWHGSWVDAYQEGLDGQLEPNAIYQKGHTLLEQVPTAPVRHYFLLNDPGKRYEVQRLVRRLQRMDVDVYQLTAPLEVADFRPYARRAVATTLPTGTYWIPMAQAQKHWIQAMLNEDTYIPHDVTYDVTGWSNPLLMNVAGGSSGLELSPQASIVPPLTEPAPPQTPAEGPTVALFQGPGSTALESRGAVRWLFDQVWHLPFTLVTGSDIASGGLTGADVLIMPDGYSTSALQALGAKGKKALVSWTNAGGRVIAWEGSAEVVTRTGVSTAVLHMPHTNMPGSLVHVGLDQGSPLADGVGDFDWAMFEDDPVMTPGLGTAPVSFPPASSPDFFVSGLDEGAQQLGGTAAVVDEPVGNGRAIVLSFDPVFRGWADGTERILWNGIFGPDPTTAVAPAAGSVIRYAAERRAEAAARSLPDVPSPIRVFASPADAGRVATVLGRYGAGYVRRAAAGRAMFLVANPGGLSAEEHPYLAPLLRDLVSAGIRGLSVSVPS